MILEFHILSREQKMYLNFHPQIGIRRKPLNQRLPSSDVSSRVHFEGTSIQESVISTLRVKFVA